MENIFKGCVEIENQLVKTNLFISQCNNRIDMAVILISYTFYEMLIKMKAENCCNFMPFRQKWVV